MFEPEFHYDLALGVDPGLSGALACRSWGEYSAHLYKMGQGPTEICEIVDNWALEPGSRRIAFLEEVGGYTGHPQPGSRMFKFGRNFGQVEMILVARGFKLVRVRPQVWQKWFSLLSRKGETKSEHKRRICARARELHPELSSITLSNCDALMILLWGVSSIPWKH